MQPPPPPPPGSEAAAAAPLEEEPSEQFHETVSHVLMASEELRQHVLLAQQQQPISVGAVLSWQQELDQVLPGLDALARWTDDAAGRGLQADLLGHVEQKVSSVARLALTTALQVPEPTDPTEDDAESASQASHDVPFDIQRRDLQSAVARLTELNLLLLENAQQGGGGSGNEDPTSLQQASDEIIDEYISYQRQILRQRARPAIAELVQARQDGSIAAAGTAQQATHPVVQHHLDDEDDDDEEEEKPRSSYRQYHAPVLTLVLGQAAALIHPLSEWKAALPPDIDTGMVERIRKLCQGSITVLDEQAQILTKTVSDWFFEDRPAVEELIQQSSATQSPPQTTSSSSHANDNKNHSSSMELGFVDGLVEEMAFSCQVQARYIALLESTQTTTTDEKSTLEQELLPIWTLKYAALERCLALQQWQSALSVATPVTIVVGTDIQVPSVVEDAQYLSTRALERAASTRSTQAIGTVGHLVNDIWSTELEGCDGVHQALLEQRGCWSGATAVLNEDEDIVHTSPPKSGDFASALLGALDDELGAAPKAATPQPLAAKKPGSAPGSGNFLGFSLASDKAEEVQMDTQICVANGFHAASVACRSLVEFLDSLLLSPDGEEEGEYAEPSPLDRNDKAMSMVKLVREELFRYAGAYQKMLEGRVTESLELWCGPTTPVGFLRAGLCFVDLRCFFDQEDYNIDASGFTKAEEEARLDRDLVGALKNSTFLMKLPEKCEADVLQEYVRLVVTAVVEIVLDSIWNGNKRFTDWGSLLLSKQVRMLQNFVSKTLSPPSPDGDLPIAATTPAQLLIWERLSQVLTALQLEKPSDWLSYQSTSVLSVDDLGKTLSLRIDFSNDAIQATTASVTKLTATAGQI